MNVNISAVATAITLSLLAGTAYSSEQNQQKTEVIQSVVDTVASSLEVHIASIEHQPADTKAKCPGGYCYRAEITLTNKGKKRDWWRLGNLLLQPSPYFGHKIRFIRNYAREWRSSSNYTYQQI